MLVYEIIKGVEDYCISPGLHEMYRVHSTMTKAKKLYAQFSTRRLQPQKNEIPHTATVGTDSSPTPNVIT